MLQSLHSANPESDNDRLRVVWTVAAGGLSFVFGFGLAPTLLLDFPRFPASERGFDCAVALLRSFEFTSRKTPEAAASLGGWVVSSVSGSGVSALLASSDLSMSRFGGTILVMSRRRFLDLLLALGGGDEGGVEGGPAPHEEGSAEDDMTLDDGETTLK